MCKFNKALILCLLLLLISFQERSEPPTRANKNAKELGVGEDTGRESIAEYLKCLKKKKKNENPNCSILPMNTHEPDARVKTC